MNRMKEKEWNSFINAWIRESGCTAAAAFEGHDDQVVWFGLEQE